MNIITGFKILLGALAAVAVAAFTVPAKAQGYYQPIKLFDSTTAPGNYNSNGIPPIVLSNGITVNAAGLPKIDVRNAMELTLHVQGQSITNVAFTNLYLTLAASMDGTTNTMSPLFKWTAVMTNVVGNGSSSNMLSCHTNLGRVGGVPLSGIPYVIVQTISNDTLNGAGNTGYLSNWQIWVNSKP